MATNSKREQIIAAVASGLGDLPKINSVKRRRPNIKDLEGIAQTQLPLAAVTAGLPVPVEHIDRSRGHERADLFLSELTIEVVVYDLLYGDDEYDTRVSELADDLWVKLWADQTWGGLAEGTHVEPDAMVAIWDPYLAFKLICKTTYKHTTGGI